MTVENKIVDIQGKKAIIDSDVAELYGVETREINQAVKNNPDKFPEGYILNLDKSEWQKLKSKFLTSMQRGGKVKAPKAFTERGLYMLATILKGARATDTTLTIIETFTKIQELKQITTHLAEMKKDNPKHQALLQDAGEMITDLITPRSFETEEREATIELDFAVIKLKYSVKKKI